jgi:hypothetical protein
VCGSEEGVHRFAVTVDGDPLRLQPDLCGDHGDSYLLRVGKVMGELVRENGESGRSISARPAGTDEPFRHLDGSIAADSPNSNKTGRSSELCGERYTTAGGAKLCCINPKDHHGGHDDPPYSWGWRS